MKKIVLLSLLLAAAGCSSPRLNKDSVVLCGDNQVKIINMAKTDGADVKEIWSFNTYDLQGQIDQDILVTLWSFDECKLVDRNRKLLLTCNHATMLLDIKTKRMLFYAETPMVHSAEMLPDGKIAVVNSTHPLGNSIEIYDLDRPVSPVYKDTLYSGHGVVWMKSARRLYALNYDSLKEYRLRNWKSDNPELKLVSSTAIPVVSGHDLSPVDKHTLLLTGHDGVYTVDIRSKKFTPFEPLKDMIDVKSANYNPETGRLVYTVGEISWWTHHVYQLNPDRTATFETINIYKARPVRKITSRRP